MLDNLESQIKNSASGITDFFSLFENLTNSGGISNLLEGITNQINNISSLENSAQVLINNLKSDGLTGLANTLLGSAATGILGDLTNLSNVYKNLTGQVGSLNLNSLNDIFNNSSEQINNGLNSLSNLNESGLGLFSGLGGVSKLGGIGVNSDISDFKTINGTTRESISKGIVDEQTNESQIDSITNKQNIGTGVGNLTTDRDSINQEIMSSELSQEGIENNIKSISHETPGISEYNEEEPTLDNSDQTSQLAQEVSLTESDVGNESQLLFQGIKLQNDGGGDALASLRAKYFESQSMLEGYQIPWDGRLGAAYTNTQSIGNNMPYGEEWVGSPSIMNRYALIRFDQIAGRQHHHKLIDQRSNTQFRSSRLQPNVTLNTLKKDGVNFTTSQEKVKGSNGQEDLKTRVFFSDSKSAAEMGITSKDSVYQDESGALYIDEIDTGIQIWVPTQDGKTSTGKLVKEPAELEVVLNRQGNIDATLRQTQIQTEKNGQVWTDDMESSARAQIQTELNEQDKQNGIKNSSVITPNQPEYWYAREDWVRCPEGSGPYVPRNYCENDKIKSGKIEENSEEAQALAQQMKETKEKVDLQTKRGWKFSGRYGSNKRYLKSPNSAPVSMKIIEPDIQNLVNHEYWKGREQFIYQWSDFLYCSNLDIPNNRLITLRRFPVPVNDSATVPKQEVNHQHILPVATAVTWLGEETGNRLNELLAWTTRINWKEMEGDVNRVDGNEQGSESSPFGEGVAKWLGRIDAVSGGGKFGQVSGWDEQRAKFDPYTDGEYAGRIYGPVNVITKTYMRNRGIEFVQDIKVNFHYTLKSIGGINPKAAMLDILSNFLALTYNNANFWGGANRYFPNKPQYPFLGAERGFKAWYKGDVTGFIDGVADQFTSALKDFGSMFQGLFTNPVEALKKLASGGAKVWMAEKQKDKRPGILPFKGLLTGEPVGEWHLVIGNPFNPIAMIGNLIVEDVSWAFSGEKLGVDDFPEELTISVNLKHGRMRDKGDIESMFNRGAGRLHYSYFSKTEPWNSAQSTKNIAIMKAATTYDDNFDGKTKKISGIFTGREADTKGLGSADLRVTTANVLGSTTDQAYKLAEKVGFKSGS